MEEDGIWRCDGERRVVGWWGGVFPWEGGTQKNNKQREGEERKKQRRRRKKESRWCSDGRERRW